MPAHQKCPRESPVKRSLLVNSTSLTLRGLVLFFNPLDERVTRQVQLPLYYAGLTDQAWIREQESKARRFKLDSEHQVKLTATVPPRGVTWFVITARQGLR